MNIGGYSTFRPNSQTFPNAYRSNPGLVTTGNELTDLNTVNSLITTSDEWQRVGTLISPVNAGDSVQVDATLTVDTINEKTLNNGVTIDSVIVKDGRVTNSTTAAPLSDAELANKKYVDDQMTIENLWDRTGTVLSAHTAGDTISISGIEMPTATNIDIKDANDSTLNIINSTTGKKVDITTDGTINSKGLILGTGNTIDVLDAGDSTLNIHNTTSGKRVDIDCDGNLSIGNTGIANCNIMLRNSGISVGAEVGMKTSGTYLDFVNTSVNSAVRFFDNLGQIATIFGLNFYVNYIGSTDATKVSFIHPVASDTINEYNTNVGVTIEGNLLKDSDITIGTNSLVDQDKYYSMCGYVTTPTITTGTGTVTLSSCIVVLKASLTAVSKKYTIASVVDVAVNDDSLNYILVSYTGGVPVYTVTTSSATVDYYSVIPIASIYRKATAYYIHKYGQNCTNTLIRNDEYLSSKMTRTSGLIMTTSTNELAITGGTIYYGTSKITISAKTTTDVFSTNHFDGLSWAVTTGLTTWSSTQYNNVASGLVTLSTANKRTFYDVWLMIDTSNALGGVYHLVYGQAEYDTQEQTEAVAIMTYLPNEISGNVRGVIYIGRLSFKKSDATATVRSAFENILPISSVTSHDKLANLSADDHTQYFKVTGRNNETLALSGSGSITWSTGALKDVNWVTTYVDTPTIGLKKHTDYEGFVYQNPSDGYSAYQFFQRNDGTFIEMYNATYAKTDDYLHSVAGNAYITYFIYGNVSTYGSYNKAQGDPFVGPVVFEYGMDASLSSWVSMPGVYSQIVGATNRDLFIDSTGKLGYDSSLREHKEIVQKDYTPLIYALNVVSYKRKKLVNGVYVNDPDATTESGCIADEVENIQDGQNFCYYDDVSNPPGVKIEKKESAWKLCGIQYSKFIGPMIKCIQTQKAKIDTLESENSEQQAAINIILQKFITLENQNNILQQRIVTLESQCGTLQQRLVAGGL